MLLLAIDRSRRNESVIELFPLIPGTNFHIIMRIEKTVIYSPLFCVCVCLWACTMICMWLSKDNFTELILSIFMWIPRIELM